MAMDPKRLEQLREIGSRPVRLTADGRMFIGDDEFFYPVAKDSIKVERYRSGKNARHALTLTLYVGDVTMERPVDLWETRRCIADGCDQEMTATQKTREELDALFEKRGWSGRWCRLHHGSGD